MITMRFVVYLITFLGFTTYNVAAQVPYGGDHQSYEGTRIYRIGDYSHRIREFQDYAILNAIDYLLSAGVARPAIRQITIEPDRNAGGSSGFPLSTSYRLWIKIDDCPSNIFMRAGSTGRLTGVDDGKRCLIP